MNRSSACPTVDATVGRYIGPGLEVLLRVARRLTSDLADAEDLVQDKSDVVMLIDVDGLS